MSRKSILGRRRSDWLIPLGLVAIGALALGWALDNRAKNEDIKRLNASLQRTLRLSNRAIEARDHHTQALKPQIPTAAPTASATP